MAYSSEELQQEMQRRQQKKAIEAEMQRRQQMNQNTTGPQAAQQQPGMWERLNQNPQLQNVASSYPVQSILAKGDYLNNAMSKAGRSVVNPALSLMGKEQIQEAPLKTGEGPDYEFASKLAPYELGIPAALMSPQMALGEAVMASSGIGALLSPEDPVGGALSGAAFGAFGEALPSVAKGAGEAIGWAGDKLNRNIYSEGLMESMTKHFKDSKKEAMSYLNPLLDKYGSKDLPDEAALNIMDMYESNKQYLGNKVGNMYKKFEKNPTIAQAQKLQSQIGDRMRKIKDTDPNSIDAMDAMESTRESIIDSMKTGFDQFGDLASGQYDQFRNIYAKEVGPYLNNLNLNKIVHGETTGITPKRLETILLKSTEGTRSKVPQGHELRQLTDELSKKLLRSDLYQSGAGGSLGYLVGGPQGAAIGAALPKAASLIKPDVASLLMNKELSRLLGQKEFLRPLEKATKVSTTLSGAAASNVAASKRNKEK